MKRFIFGLYLSCISAISFSAIGTDIGIYGDILPNTPLVAGFCYKAGLQVHNLNKCSAEEMSKALIIYKFDINGAELMAQQSPKCGSCLDGDCDIMAGGTFGLTSTQSAIDSCHGSSPSENCSVSDSPVPLDTYISYAQSNPIGPDIVNTLRCKVSVIRSSSKWSNCTTQQKSDICSAWYDYSSWLKTTGAASLSQDLNCGKFSDPNDPVTTLLAQCGDQGSVAVNPPVDPTPQKACNSSNNYCYSAIPAPATVCGSNSNGGAGDSTSVCSKGFSGATHQIIGSGSN